MYWSCRVGEPPDPCPGAVWQKYSDYSGDSSYNGICTPDKLKLFPDSLANYKNCPKVPGLKVTCGSPLEHGLSIDDDGVRSNSII